MTLTYTDAIVDFNPLLIGSKLHGDYILFEKQKPQGYSYLSVAKDAHSKRYAESFFYNPASYILKIPYNIILFFDKLPIDMVGKWVYIKFNI